MLKTIEFDPNGSNLHAEVKITGIIIASYSLRLFSYDANQEKLIQDEVGNNQQEHDDTFTLCDQAHPNENVSNNHKRLLHLLVNINTDQTSTGYSISLRIFQGNPGNDNNLLDVVSHSGDISASDGGFSKNLGVIFNKKNP